MNMKAFSVVRAEGRKARLRSGIFGGVSWGPYGGAFVSKRFQQFEVGEFRQIT